MHKGATVYRYLQPPPGHELSEPVEWNDIENMRLTAINMITPGHEAYDSIKKAIERASKDSLRKFFRDNGFTFVKHKEEK